MMIRCLRIELLTSVLGVRAFIPSLLLLLKYLLSIFYDLLIQLLFALNF